MNDESPRRDHGSGDLFLRRRAVALTVITALIVIPAVLLLNQLFGGGDGSRDVTLPSTPHKFKDRKTGIEVRWPKGWEMKRRPGGVVLTSKDDTTAFVVGASRPGTSRAARATFRQVVGALRATYRKPRVRYAANPRQIDGLPTLGALISGKKKRGGAAQQVTVNIARGRRHVYLIEIIAPARGGRLGDVALIGRRLRLSR